MRHFEFINEAENISALKQDIIGQVEKLDDFDLLDRIYQVLSQKNVRGKIENALAVTTQDANLGDTDKIINAMMTSISNIEGSSAEKIVFVEALEAGKAVNTDALQQAVTTFDEVFPLNFAEKFFVTNANFGRGVKMKGPGEFALAIMAPNISLAAKGDIMIDGKHVEVKAAAQGKSGGRLGEVGPASKEAIVDKLNEIANKHMTEEHQLEFFQEHFLSVMSKSLAVSVMALHKLFPDNSKAIEECIGKTIDLSFPGSKLGKEVGKAAAHDHTGRQAELEYMKQNFEWYKQRDGFDSIMAIWFPGKKVYNFNDGEEFASMRSAGYLGSPSISFIPSKAMEVYSQVNFTKKPH